MAILVKAYRPPSRGGVPYEEWRDDALCSSLPAELFELGDPDVITSRDQEDLIAQGLKICAACPVRQACRVNSSELDRYWTTRGGQPPEGLFPDARMPKAELPKNGLGGGGLKSGTAKRPLKETCTKGHKDWRAREDGRRWCVTCKREHDAKRPPRKRNRRAATL